MDKKITLRSVVAKIRDKSLQDHEGNIHDHALDIFSNLSDKEKLVFIEDVVNIFSIAEVRKQHDKSSTIYIKDDVLNKFKERRENFELDIKDSLEYKNSSSLIDIKNFATKSLIVTILIGLFTFFVCILFIENNVKLPASLDFIVSLYKLLKP